MTATKNLHSSFPHGTRATLGLIVACAAAWAATCYSVASCHYVTVSFVSYRGNVFSAPLQAAGSVPVSYHVAAGLFTWSNQQQCVSYTEYQLQSGVLADVPLQAARVFAIFSVLGGLGVLLWSTILFCMSLGRYQCRLFAFCLLLLAMFMGLTQLITRSSLCNSVGSPAHCGLNNGGLVAIAALLLWLVALVISLVYVQSPNHDVIVQNGVETNLFEKRKERRLAREQARREEQQRKQLEKARLEQQLAEEREQEEHLATETEKNQDTTFTSSQPRSPLKYCNIEDDEDELEVYLTEPETPLPHDHHV